MKKNFIALFNRDIKRLYQEIEAYTDESILWKKADGIANTAGNLCLHLVGNLNEYIGRQLGGIPYQRNRPYEFSATDIPKQDLLNGIKQTQMTVEKALKSLKIKQLNEKFPENVLGYEMTVHYFLIHLNGHLNYHLGQIDYHWRFLTGESSIKFAS
jgi:hypothetical protein